MTQLSPIDVVFASAWEETAAVTWQPMHAAEFGFTGLMNP
jgi:hypothetical protein